MKHLEILSFYLVVSAEMFIFAVRFIAKTFMKKLLLTLFTVLAVNCAAQQPYVTVKDGHFMRGTTPYYYVGTNFWYGAILGSEGQGGNRQRLCRELDEMKRRGIDNLRILVGSDGERGVTTKVEPTLQVRPGVYNDTILAGLDYLLMEMQKRQMVAVLYLNNSWEWSGGYGFYLEHAGAGRQPRPDDVGYPAFMKAMASYATNQRAHKLFYDYVRFIVGRTNRYTGVKYVDDPTIMSWQIGNEPRAFSREALPAFEKWIGEAAALLHRLAPRQLVSIGSEGAWGCENDYGCWERICADPNVDYCNVHLWPYNWGWVKPDSLVEQLPVACSNTRDYITRHLAICDRIGKPLVMEEFGYPRDGFRFSTDVSTNGRDGYYRYVFSLVAENALRGGTFAGCNFWGWGGFAKPRHEQWQVGDDYTNDPAQEAQGLNSVFATDRSTLDIITSYAQRLNNIQSAPLNTPSKALAQRLTALQKKGYMSGHQDDPFYGLTWEWEWGRSDIRDLVGDYPAVMGFDLGGIEMGDRKNLDSVPFNRIREQLVAHVERGGIVTLSWHPRNPLTDGTAWDVETPGVVTSILPGGSQHQKFQTWMRRVGDFIATLKDSKGQLVPVIFRPWHENNGSWFWWGQKHCTNSEFLALWNMLQDEMDRRGFTNLLWSYSPNLDGGWTEQRFLERYPGNDRVTLIGEDAYQWGTEDDFRKGLTADLNFLSKFAKDNGRLLAMTECGLKNMTDPTWWTRVLKPIMDQYPLSYFLLWRNYKKEFFGPSKSHPCGADYQKLYEAKNVLFLNEIKDQK